MAAQQTNDKMDAKFEEIIRALLQENNFPDQTVHDLIIYSKKGVGTLHQKELKIGDLPRDLNCGKYTIESVKRKAAELHIPSHMVTWIDPKNPESIFYIANFWHYDKESIYSRLCQVKAATVKNAVEDRYEKAVYHLNKLPCVYTDKFVYKPDYHNYTGPKEVTININEETHSFDQENEDWSSRDTHWYPYLVLPVIPQLGEAPLLHDVTKVLNRRPGHEKL